MIPIIRIACVALLLLDLAAAAAPGRRETPPGPIAMEGELPARSAISGLFDKLDFQHASQIDTHAVTSSQFFGTREELKNNYLYRFSGARLGIYGNSGAEAIYVAGFVDAKGQPADASKHRYTTRFAKGELPPNDAFWSLTMYDGKTQLLIANPLNRYLINSTMESALRRDADGGITLYVQSDSPGKDKEANWLPAPNGPFYTVLRIYQPKVAAQTGKWVAPRLVPVN